MVDCHLGSYTSWGVWEETVVLVMEGVLGEGKGFQGGYLMARTRFFMSFLALVLMHELEVQLGQKEIRVEWMARDLVELRGWNG